MKVNSSFIGKSSLSRNYIAISAVSDVQCYYAVILKNWNGCQFIHLCSCLCISVLILVTLSQLLNCLTMIVIVRYFITYRDRLCIDVTNGIETDQETYTDFTTYYFDTIAYSKAGLLPFSRFLLHTEIYISSFGNSDQIQFDIQLPRVTK